MSTAMVVMVLKLMMVVAKVLRLHLSPLQVHLRPLFSPSRGFLDNTFFYGTLKREALESYAARLVAPAHCSRPQHPASPTSGPPDSPPALDQ